MHSNGLGIKTAHRLIRTHKSAETVVRVLEMECKEAPAGGYARYLQRMRIAKQTFLHQRVYDPVLGRVVPLTPPPPGAPRMPHCGTRLGYNPPAVGLM